MQADRDALGYRCGDPERSRSPAWVLTVVGTIVFVLALTQAEKYGLCTACTRSRSCSSIRPRPSRDRGDGARFPDPRGVGLLVVGLVVMHALGSWLARRHPQPSRASLDSPDEGTVGCPCALLDRLRSHASPSFRDPLTLQQEFESVWAFEGRVVKPISLSYAVHVCRGCPNAPPVVRTPQCTPRKDRS